MKKIKLLFAIACVPLLGICQDSFLDEFEKGIELLHENGADTAYPIFKDLTQKIPETDTLYDYSLWYYIASTTYLEQENRYNENFEQSLKYGKEALEAIQKGKEIFDQEFAKREYFMIKNIAVSYSGIGNFNEAKKWRRKMYEAKEKEALPQGIDEYFNFDYFVLDDKNIWGYEWYADLPEDRFSSSFTKIVYYVYSRKPDGSDKDQLYRLHVLMFHGNDQNFDYVMTKKLETAKEEISGTLYSYTYKEDIDFEKLQNDVKEIVKGEVKPDTKRTISKKKKKKGKADVKVEIF